jgi:hypothetical protein
MKVEDLVCNGGFQNWFDIYFTGKLGRHRTGGKILLETKWTLQVIS